MKNSIKDLESRIAEYESVGEPVSLEEVVLSLADLTREISGTHLANNKESIHETRARQIRAREECLNVASAVMLLHAKIGDEKREIESGNLHVLKTPITVTLRMDDCSLMLTREITRGKSMDFEIYDAIDDLKSEVGTFLDSFH